MFQSTGEPENKAWDCQGWAAACACIPVGFGQEKGSVSLCWLWQQAILGKRHTELFLHDNDSPAQPEPGLGKLCKVTHLSLLTSPLCARTAQGSSVSHLHICEYQLPSTLITPFNSSWGRKQETTSFTRTYKGQCQSQMLLSPHYHF